MAKEVIKKKNKLLRWILILLNILIIAALAVFGGYYFKKYRDLKNHPVTAEQAAQAEIDRTLASVGKLYSLPKDEKPQLRTVTDVTQLKGQAFFEKAENDDITLIYTKAKLAILYRPSTDKIINVSSVSIQSSATVKIIGADADRAAVKKLLAANFSSDITVKEEGTAKTTNTGVIVVDISGQKTDLLKKLAAGLKGTVGTLPNGEDKPTDDILIIAGAPAITP